MPSHPKLASMCEDFFRQHEEAITSSDAPKRISRSSLASLEDRLRAIHDERTDRARDAVKDLYDEWRDADPDSSSRSSGREYAPQMRDAKQYLESLESTRGSFPYELGRLFEALKKTPEIRGISFRGDSVIFHLSWMRAVKLKADNRSQNSVSRRWLLRFFMV